LGNEKSEIGQSLHKDEAGSADSKTKFQNGHQESFLRACTQNTLTLENTNNKPSKAYTYQHTLRRAVFINNYTEASDRARLLNAGFQLQCDVVNCSRE
jgi:hypothetical protein